MQTRGFQMKTFRKLAEEEISWRGLIRTKRKSEQEKVVFVLLFASGDHELSEASEKVLERNEKPFWDE